MSRILLVEDETKVRSSLQRGLEEEGHEVVAVDNGDDGYRRASVERFDCMVLDLMLPGRDGLEVLTELNDTCSLSCSSIPLDFGERGNI